MVLHRRTLGCNLCTDGTWQAPDGARPTGPRHSAEPRNQSSNRAVVCIINGNSRDAWFETAIRNQERPATPDARARATAVPAPRARPPTPGRQPHEPRTIHRRNRNDPFHRPTGARGPGIDAAPLPGTARVYPARRSSVSIDAFLWLTATLTATQADAGRPSRTPTTLLSRAVIAAHTTLEFHFCCDTVPHKCPTRRPLTVPPDLDSPRLFVYRDRIQPKST
jgi:hypothetical protein